MNRNNFDSDVIAFGKIRRIYFKKFGSDGRVSKKIFENMSWFYDEIGFSCDDVMVMKSKEGILRGMHFQTIKPQDKILYVVSGELYVAVCDIRNESEHFGEWHAIRAKEEEDSAIYIPKGFATGTYAVRDSIFLMLCSGKYEAGGDCGFRYDDPTVDIAWPIDGREIMVSDRDLSLPSFFIACRGGY